MKILLVQPDSNNVIINYGMHIYNFEPLGIYYIAATIKDNHDTMLIDLNNVNSHDHLSSTDYFIETINNYAPDIVAYSAITAVRTGRIMELCRLVKKISPDIINIVGGAHAILYPIDFNSKYIDIVISENSVKIFPQIIKAVEYSDRKNSIAKYNLSVNYTEEAIKLGEWPKPYRQIGEKYANRYIISIGKPGSEKIQRPISSIKTSLGCSFRCKYCCLWKLYPNYETNSIKSIIEDIYQLKTKYVFLADDESLLNAKFMRKLAGAIINAGIRKKFIMYGRSDSIVRHPELIGIWAKAGLNEIWIGIEGATDDQLKNYEKRNSTASHAKAIRICKHYGVKIHATALVSYEFRRRDFEYMLEYTREKLKLTSCHFFVLTPFKGTDYYCRLYESNRAALLTTDSDHYSIRQSILRPIHMSIGEFHYRYAKLQKEFNSDTIPVCKLNDDIDQDLKCEYEMLRGKNYRLLMEIENAQTHYANSRNESVGINTVLISAGRDFK